MEENQMLTSILKEMGTQPDKLKLEKWELFDEIIRRIHIHRDERRRHLAMIRDLQKRADALRQLHFRLFGSDNPKT